MKLDSELTNLLNDIIDNKVDNEVDTEVSSLWNDTQGWVKLADLTDEHFQRILTIRPRSRTYLKQSDAGYDWAVGKQFVVTSRNSQYHQQVVAVDEVRHLKRSGYTHVHIQYNTNSAPLELEL